MNVPTDVQPFINDVCEQFNQQFGERIQAIFLLGSLGEHGGFSLCSDVDVAVVLDQVVEADYLDVKAVWDALLTIDHPYASRLSVFWSSYCQNDFASGKGRFPPLDRLDFLKHAKLIQGQDQRSSLPGPSENEVISASAKFIVDLLLKPEKLEELNRHPEVILAKGSRYFSKSVLFPVRLLYTIDQPLTVASNQEAVNYFLDKYPCDAELENLVKAAYAARSKPVDQSVEFSGDFQKPLKQLYQQCIDAYLQKLSEQDVELAQALIDVRNNLYINL